MLTLALAATLVGFVLLVLGLITGTLWLAISCIVVCLAGLGFLIADVVGKGRRGADDEPTLADFVESDARPEPHPHPRTADGSDRSAGDGPGAPEARSAPGGPKPAHGSSVGRSDEEPPRSVPPAGGRHGRAPGVPAAQPEQQSAPNRDSNYDDYLKSVGGYPAAPPPSPESDPGHGGSGADAAVTESFPSPPGQGPVSPPPSSAPSTLGDEHGDPDRSPEQRRQRFDPLDPNWHPPLD
ncbi:hypothetical protein GIY30_07155 [Gordonia sp. HNM0687]|uniref:Uncharacterized protein n=1 Tax=Gordonia mangrovi TaxID=2665643 RepID=A0A6L7GMJ4_9ACTN|nr:hypothetical protein [Gordonia mangrovi]MXP21130.1 hypothetical protein [Gordonia mangrovi]UVF78332.1 hypothetical protein NWF22_00075 [Gordonia mangrovi]